jgi:hypothetical protein
MNRVIKAYVTEHGKKGRNVRGTQSISNFTQLPSQPLLRKSSDFVVMHFSAFPLF